MVIASMNMKGSQDNADRSFKGWQAPILQQQVREGHRQVQGLCNSEIPSVSGLQASTCASTPLAELPPQPPAWPQCSVPRDLDPRATHETAAGRPACQRVEPPPPGESSRPPGWAGGAAHRSASRMLRLALGRRAELSSQGAKHGSLGHPPSLRTSEKQASQWSLKAKWQMASLEDCFSIAVAPSANARRACPSSEASSQELQGT